MRYVQSLIAVMVFPTCVGMNRLPVWRPELAAKIGVTRQTLLAIEAAKYSPSPELAFRIARVFGVPLDAVFQYEA